MDITPIIFSHMTALEWLRALSLRDAWSGSRSYLVAAQECLKILAHSAPTATSLRSLFDGAAERPVDLLVGAANRRCQANNARSHVMGNAPSSSFLWHGVTEGLYACSPELVFCQLAARSSLPEACLLGMELCGSFSLLPGLDGGLSKRAPLTSPEALASALDDAGAGPRSTGRRALRYVCPNSASPMESRAALLMIAPSRLGGWSLPQPELNGMVELDRKGRRLLGCERLYCDMLWPAQRVAVEYDSLTFHGTSSSLARTLDRRTALEGAGYTVISLTASDLHSFRDFDSKMVYLRSLLGKRPICPSASVVAARRTLIRDLAAIDWV